MNFKIIAFDPTVNKNVDLTIKFVVKADGGIDYEKSGRELADILLTHVPAGIVDTAVEIINEFQERNS